MSTVAGRRCLELALAITLALQSTTGWTVLLAVVVYWVVVVVVAGLIDERAEARANVAGEPPGAAAVSDTPAKSNSNSKSKSKSTIRLAALPNTPLRPADLRPGLDTPRQWRRHIIDVAAYEEERYPRQDVCTTVDVFLRAGDALVLAFHPHRTTATHLRSGAAISGVPPPTIRSGWTFSQRGRCVCRSGKPACTQSASVRRMALRRVW